MSRAVITKSLLTAIADAIRTKTGKSAAMTPAQMASEITAIPTADDDSLNVALGGGGGTINYNGTTIRPYAFYSYSDAAIALNAPNVTEIKRVALSGAYLSGINLPAVTKIEDSAFENLTFSLFGKTTSVIPVTSLGNRAFDGLRTNSSYGTCAWLLNFSQLKTLPKECFFNSTGITHVTQDPDFVLPQKGIAVCIPSITTGNINSKAFSYCGIVRVDLPYVTTIGSSVFENCARMATVNIPAATVIQSNAFARCYALAAIDLPAVQSLGSGAFLNCSALKAVVLRYNGVVTLTNADAFSSTPIASGTGYIYVPDDLVDQYKAATNWVTYAAQIKPISEYTPEV